MRAGSSEWDNVFTLDARGRETLFVMCVFRPHIGETAGAEQSKRILLGENGMYTNRVQNTNKKFVQAVFTKKR